MKILALLLGLAVLTTCANTHAQQQIADADALYRFRKGETSRHQLLIVTDTTTNKEVGGPSSVGREQQHMRQELVIEQKILDVDGSGSAEIQVTFRSAKTEVKISSGADRERKPPDVLQYIAGKSFKMYVTADGEILAVEQVASLINAARETAKDAALQELIVQTFSEDYFKELLQNLYPRMPLQTVQKNDGWQIVSDMTIPRTAFKLRIARKFSLSRTETGTTQLNIRGDIKAMPVDPITPPNPSSPFVEVLLSNIAGNAEINLAKGVVISSDSVQRLKMRTTKREQQPRGRGDVRIEVITDANTTMTIKLLK
jgi:hypothetical protein